MLRATAITSKKLSCNTIHLCKRTLYNYTGNGKGLSDRKLTDEERAYLDPMIRVDQAGEVGAYYIYKGQIAVLGKDKNLRPILQEMWDQEKEHLARFDHLLDML
ncbi:hypothetical protein G6F42_028664 [Rhizopus arrhizus]|nr:hypothetical protein G6F42_028664 [Rhizopus arrhizus]